MRKTVLTLTLFLFTMRAFAGEGMWLPFLLQQLNEKEMQSMGLKITAEDIYSVSKGSLKDATLIFGGGCTGEVISNKGLVLTNHHCGYGSVNALSSVSNDYLTNGFFAKNQTEEIPCPGLSVRFIRKIEEVTDLINTNVTDRNSKVINDSILEANIKALKVKAEKESGLEIEIKSFFYGNEFYMFYVERFEDVRLVGFPPNGIGKFGGDTDNWAWPRHTGDFGLFRIYANTKNQAAKYDKNNVPYIPVKHFKINISGVQDGDFAMVYGFPGRTSQYLTSDGINETMNVLDPARIRIREKRLSIIESAMKVNKANFIKYASKQAGIANYYKKWQGELLGLRLNDAVNKKRAQEADFINWTNQDPFRMEAYGHIIEDQSEIYKTLERDYLQYTYITECLEAPEFIKSANLFKTVQSVINKKEKWDLDNWLQGQAGRLNGMDMSTDLKIAQELFAIYQNEFGADNRLSNKMLQQAYSQSIFLDTNKLGTLLRTNDTLLITRTLSTDPVTLLFLYIDSNYNATLAKLKPNFSMLNENYKTYMQGLREYSNKPLYPDANFSLRLSYGKIEGIVPQDGMRYDYYTTLGGAVRKRNPEIEEFNMPQRLVDLYYKKDFGRYGITHHGQPEVPLCFLGSLHTTGGNSGSPVLNAYGELIGTNFDRIWEGTMSDILYDVNLCRNITVDIRYTLFIIDKYGEAPWVIEELDLVESRR